MSGPRFCSAADAVATIRDGQTVAASGVIGWITPDAVLRALGERFERTQSPRALTCFFPVATGDALRIKGMDHIAREGLLRRLISGSYINSLDPATGLRPAVMRLIKENKIEAHAWPIGATMHWLREVARKSPGYMTEVGLGTYIDPELDGGRLNQKTVASLVEKITFRGKPYLFYPAFPIDVALIRATSSDPWGNLGYDDEALISANLALAIAAKACGGRVIAQVKRIVPAHSRRAQDQRIPGQFVDDVVIVPDQPLVTNIDFDAHYIGPGRLPLIDFPALPGGADKIIARRAAREIQPRRLTIFGFGASSDVPAVMAEDGLLTDDNIDDYWFTTEHGSYGGLVMSGWQFSANLNPQALIDGLTQFDVIDGGLCRCALLAFAQFDARGCVNVSKFGSANPGAGGFIDIAHNAEQLIFCGPFTTGGIRVSAYEGRLRIDAEGKVIKFVPAAEQITYDVRRGVAERGQRAMLITERAVFDVMRDGLCLREIAPGADLRRDILDQMDFQPRVVDSELKAMPAEIFR